MYEKIKSVMQVDPGILSRFHRDLFVETPVYRSVKNHRPVYINLPLFYQLFEITSDLSYDEVSDLLSDVFSTTIEKQAGTGEVVGSAFVDKQSDPLGLSLSGNLGSGRAYYCGRYFNIKGEKTPLAKSDQKKYSDGYLEMERAVWETVVSNALQGSISTGVNPVLAIFDMDEYCDVGWRDQPVKRARMVRVDLSGELDRVTHNFYLETPLDEKRLIKTAECFGRLEGDKFTERLIHGTWSPGNISLDGHLIDLDTVGAVKGRSPVYSSTRWHHENRFGFEHYGQLHILKALCDDTRVNTDGARYDDLSLILMDTRSQHIKNSLIKLMGLEDCREYILSHHKDKLENLNQMFIELSQKTVFKDGGLLTKGFDAATLHLFDFARFMRFYPLLKMNKDDVREKALDLLLNNPEEFHDIEHDVDDMARDYIEKVYDVISDCFVTDEFDYKILGLGLKSFIVAYDDLVTDCLENNAINLGVMARNAYILNEDRYYMMPYFTASYHVAKWAGQEDADVTQKKIDTLIQANRRLAGKGRVTDIRLYREGYFYVRFDTVEHAFVCFEFWKKHDMPERRAEIDIGGIILKGAIRSGGFISDPNSFYDLKNIILQKISLHTPKIAIYTQYEDKRIMQMHDLIDEDE